MTQARFAAGRPGTGSPAGKGSWQLQPPAFPASQPPALVAMAPSGNPNGRPASWAPARKTAVPWRPDQHSSVLCYLPSCLGHCQSLMLPCLCGTTVAVSYRPRASWQLLSPSLPVAGCIPAPKPLAYRPTPCRHSSDACVSIKKKRTRDASLPLRRRRLGDLPRRRGGPPAAAPPSAGCGASPRIAP